MTSITYISLWHLLVTIPKITATADYLKWPLRLLTASEVTSDLDFELRDLDDTYAIAYYLSLTLKSLFSPGRRRKQN